MKSGPGKITKLLRSLPWLVRYPFWRAHELFDRFTEGTGLQHLIILVANHFEPSWSPNGIHLDWNAQLSRVDGWCRMARKIGSSITDSDGTPFRHTNFYPAEQYHAPLLDRLAELQAEGLGEVEVHLHHGIDQPDTATALRNALENFRDILANEHRLLSRAEECGQPKYAFVHGNLALGNSAGGKYCGVDSEMEILKETGCYADFTLPSAPDETQVPKINAIYECGHPLAERVPHRSGPDLQVGAQPHLPVIFTGPLVFNWKRRVHGLPFPRLDDGVLAANYPLDFDRLHRLANARITVRGRPDWIFIKLYCHGFFTYDQGFTIGDSIRRYWQEILNLSQKTGSFKIHFVTAREAFNIALAAVDGKKDEPELYRDYRLRTIMQSSFPKEVTGGSFQQS